jgi:ubiquinone/menaquinone biosynthesis C-methylase UbiE
MNNSDDLSKTPDQKSGERCESLQKEELEFWERQTRCGNDVDLKLARDLPDDTPDFILRMLSDFEDDAARFCFAGAKGRVLDAGCGNGNLLLRALGDERGSRKVTDLVGMDFSRNMLDRAASRAAGQTEGDARADFLQGSVTNLPFRDQSFDWVASSGVLTCLPTVRDARDALLEFNRVLRPGGTMVVDFFNRISHYTLARKHIFGESINPPEYVSPSEFNKELADAGFQVLGYRGFDYKPCQGYLFMSRWRPLVDPLFVQERLSRFLECNIMQGSQALSLLGYRIYVKCFKK